MRKAIRHSGLAITSMVALTAITPSLSAAPPVALAPVARASRVRVAPANPKATAIVMAALARFANGLPGGAFDKAIADRLNKIPNARATALRIAGPFERASAAERAGALPNGASDFASPSKPFELTTYVGVSPASSSAAILATPPTVLAAEKATPNYELSYAGLACTTPSAPAGDKPLEYLTLVGQLDNINGVDVDKKSFPPSGPLTGIVGGSNSSQGAGVAWSRQTFQSFIVLSALLLDEGDLEAKKQEVDLLVALSENFANALSGPDLTMNRKIALDYTLGVLQLSNPDKWSPNAVKTKLITSTDYDALFTTAPQTTNGIQNKLSFSHDTKGGNYTVYFTAPTSPPSQEVKVTLKRVVALGSNKDSENGLADHIALIEIGRANGSSEYAQKVLPHNDNDVSPYWVVSRKMVTGQGAVRITLNLTEHDDPVGPLLSCPLPWSNYPILECYCGPSSYQPPIKLTPPPPKPYPLEQGHHWKWLGYCPNAQNTPVDVSPAGSKSLTLDYNMNTGNITGDATGKKGDVLTITGKDPTRKAKVEITVN